jgi:hypothetical protein
VPNRRLILSAGMISDYKFLDYYSAFGMDEPAPVRVEALLDLGRQEFFALFDDYQRPGLTDLQARLVKSFPVL